MTIKAKSLSVSAAAILSASVIATPFIAKHEGLRLAAYYDPVGIPTICYGYTRGVNIEDERTQQECDHLLNNEVTKYINLVDNYIDVPMPDTRRAALASFAYNVGEGNFKRSTLRKLMNEGQTRRACNELSRWVWAQGVRLRGLIRRREAERQLCLEGLPEDV